MNRKNVFSLIVRYLFLFLVGAFGFSLIYIIMSPLTIIFSALFLNAFYPSLTYSLSEKAIIIGSDVIKIVEACVAGAAYYLLLILVFTTPMTLNKRIKSISFMFISFFLINIVRIFVFSCLFIQRSNYFNLAHMFFWYVGSTLLVVGLWFINVKIFNIKAIPIYSDALFLIKLINKGTKK